MTALAVLLLAGADFARDVRPILSDACFACHGPDAAKRKAGLRLDTPEGVKPVELWKRLNDAEKPMPPKGATRQLSAAEKATIKAWIDAGARWQPHWAFVAPVRAALPEVKGDWPRTPVDRFVLARLEREGRTPSPDAPRAAWLRRVTLDLTGVPPTIAEQDAFLADDRPSAEERVVERLLASPRFGERMAIRWLDAARYADTSGYQNDGERVMWRWRDGVIEAFNHNTPFDQFTREQLAGDQIPGATIEQKIASGFNRNHRGNAEGGIVPEEYAAEYVADRVETTAAVWLGLTAGCARCHDHKYDPVTQKEFYRLFAFFNNVPERGKAVKFGNSPPMLLSPTRRQRDVLNDIERQLTRARREVQEGRKELDDLQARWEATKPKIKEARPKLRDERESLFGESILGFHLEKSGRVVLMGGRPIEGRAFDGRLAVNLGDSFGFSYLSRFTFSVWAKPKKPDGALFARATHVPDAEGYSVRLRGGKVEVNLVKRWLDDAIRVETVDKLPLNEATHIAVRYDRSRQARGVSVFLNGKPAKLKVLVDDLNQDFATKEAFWVGNAEGENDGFVGLLRDLRGFARDLTNDEIVEVATDETEESILTTPAVKRTPGQRLKLKRYYVKHQAPDRIEDALRLVEDLERRKRDFVDTVPTTMVMQDMPTPRPTFVLKRGQYDQPGERVTPGVPAGLSPWPTDAATNRLGLAGWIVDAKNPLAARVAVNRVWGMLFGVGLVKTAEDFGTQGEPPSHPELLDWLAVEFRESGWDVKRLVGLIVTSRVYRQSSRRTTGDPENRLLSRGPRVRLSAEMVRDQALFAAGLLTEQLGGPSVKPYQPDGLWNELADVEYRRDKGASLYRRGLYVYWKRTVAPPGLATFDAPGREACSVRETRTNTPLQALNLLNDVTYVEAARVLGERAIREAEDDAGRVAFVVRRVLARASREAETRVLLAALKRHRLHYSANVEDAREAARAGESPPDDALDVVERAAFAAVASTVLNLDEAINKE